MFCAKHTPGLPPILAPAVAPGDVALDAHGVAEVKRRASYESMVCAIERGYAPAVQRLLGEGSAVDNRGRDDFGEFPIVAAAAKGDLAIVEVLLAAGANPNSCCCSCVTALHRAIEGGHTAVVARLLKGGADPRERREGRTPPLELARQTKNPEIVRLIEDALAGQPDDETMGAATRYRSVAILSWSRLMHLG